MTFNLYFQTEKEILKLKIERSQISRKLKSLESAYNQSFIDEFPDSIEIEG